MLTALPAISSPSDSPNLRDYPTDQQICMEIEIEINKAVHDGYLTAEQGLGVIQNCYSQLG